MFSLRTSAHFLARAMLRPAEIVLGRLTLPWKTILVTTAVLAPLALVLFPYLSVQGSTIAFARHELQALAYVQPLDAVLDDAVLASSESRNGRTVPAQLVADIGVLSDVDARLGTAVQSTTLWRHVRGSLQDAAATQGQPVSVSGPSWNKALSELVALSAQVGATSNLTLDPRRQSYFLGDILITQAPTFAVNAAIFRNESRGHSTQGVANQAVALGAQSAALAAMKVDLASAHDDAAWTRGMADQVTRLGQATDEATTIAAITEIQHRAAASLSRLLHERISQGDQAQATVVGATAAALMVAAWLVAALIRQTRRSTRSLIDALAGLAAGDLTARTELDTRDEFQLVATHANRAADRLHETLAGMLVQGTALATVAEGLTSAAGEANDGAAESARRSRDVAVATGQISGNISEVARATSQMRQAIEEIAKTSATAALITSDAAHGSELASATIAKLGASSEEVGRIVGLIAGIASQTHLLALNAHIEASRAGSGGAAFGVVADEVKQLAAAASRAADDVTVHVRATEADVKAASSAITEISLVVSRVNDLQGVIAAAVEEQAVTTAAISRTIDEVEDAATQITGALSEAAGQAANSSLRADRTAQTASELSLIAAHLRDAANGFTF